MREAQVSVFSLELWQSATIAGASLVEISGGLLIVLLVSVSTAACSSSSSTGGRMKRAAADRPPSPSSKRPVQSCVLRPDLYGELHKTCIV